MSYVPGRAKLPDQDLCYYGLSKLAFRGPKKATDDRYVAVIGGTETYGRFIAKPFCDLVEEQLDLPVLNLGCQNAGLDAFLQDPDVLSLAKGAQVTVLQVLGAQNMSNRFYRVHPRRNDRFLGPSKMLKSVFPEIDFTEFSFVRHMLATLQMSSPERFGVLRDEIQQAWVARMKLVLRTIDGPVILLWLRQDATKRLGSEPLFVGADMVHDVADGALGVVEMSAERAGRNLKGMIVGPLDESIAAEMLGFEAHSQIAEALSAALKPHL